MSDASIEPIESIVFRRVSRSNDPKLHGQRAWLSIKEVRLGMINFWASGPNGLPFRLETTSAWLDRWVKQLDCALSQVEYTTLVRVRD
jgi:hypothetical protein